MDLLTNRLMVVHGSWPMVHGSWLVPHGSWPKQEHRAWAWANDMLGTSSGKSSRDRSTLGFTKIEHLNPENMKIDKTLTGNGEQQNGDEPDQIHFRKSEHLRKWKRHAATKLTTIL